MATLDFPPEVLDIVCSFVSKELLESVRQGNKALEQAASKYLFDTIFMSFNMAELRIAQQVIIKFKQNIRTLIFSSRYYSDVELGDFDYGFKWVWPYVEEYAAHAEYAYEQSILFLKSQEDVIRDGALSAYLSFALSNIPNLQKIVLTDLTSTRSMSSKTMREFGSEISSQCPVSLCRITTCEGHFDLNDEPVVVEPGFERNDIFNPLRTILLALSTTKTTVGELTMETCDDTGHGELPCDTTALEISLPDLIRAKLCFKALTKLRLGLDICPEGASNPIDKAYYVQHNTPQLLRAAVNLQYFTLEIYKSSDWTKFGSDDDDTLFKALLGECELPKLKSFILANAWSTENELIRFLERSPQLEQLTIHCHLLIKGSCPRIADAIKMILPALKSIELQDIEVSDTYTDVGYRYSNIKRDDVEQFFFGSGDNPFIGRSWMRYIVDPGAEEASYKVRPEPKGYVDRYHYFHG